MLDKIQEVGDFVKTVKAAKNLLSGDDDKTTTQTEITQPRSIKKARSFNLTAQSGKVDAAPVATGANFSIHQFLALQLRNILNGKLSSLIGGK